MMVMLEILKFDRRMRLLRWDAISRISVCISLHKPQIILDYMGKCKSLGRDIAIDETLL